jgi:methanogenic corrinoid protein MtbC1
MTAMAHSALSRLCNERKAREMSPDIRSALGDPVAAALAYALCDRDESTAQELVDDLLEAGLSVEDICLDHLAPAARRLGELWDTDRLPFAEVTMATGRIQAIVRHLPRSRVPITCTSGRGALFCAVPGEEHTLGVMMAADLFRRHGWDVGLLMGLDHDDLIARIADDDRPVVGLSCSGDHSYKALCDAVAAIRARRPDATILLSGQIVQTPARVEALAEDVTIVPDVAAAEAEIARLEAGITKAALAGLARSSAA